MASKPGADRTMSVTPRNERLGKIHRMHREIDGRVLAVRNDIFRDIASDAHHLESAALLRQHAGAEIECPRHRTEAARCLAIAKLDLPSYGIFALPELQHRFLADDHRRGARGLILPLETAPGENADAGGLEIVAADNVLARPIGVSQRHRIAGWHHRTARRGYRPMPPAEYR